MTEDPIVAEVRAIRQQMFKECGNNLYGLVQYLRSQRMKYPPTTTGANAKKGKRLSRSDATGRPRG